MRMIGTTPVTALPFIFYLTNKQTSKKRHINLNNNKKGIQINCHCGIRIWYKFSFFLWAWVQMPWCHFDSVCIFIFLMGVRLNALALLFLLGEQFIFKEIPNPFQVEKLCFIYCSMWLSAKTYFHKNHV